MDKQGTGPWSPDVVESVRRMRSAGASINACEAALRRTREVVERLYPDFPYHIEGEAVGVLGDLVLSMGPDLHDEGTGRVRARVTDYDRVGDAEAALLLAALDYLDGAPWRAPDFVA